MQRLKDQPFSTRYTNFLKTEVSQCDSTKPMCTCFYRSKSKSTNLKLPVWSHIDWPNLASWFWPTKFWPTSNLPTKFGWLQITGQIKDQSWMAARLVTVWRHWLFGNDDDFFSIFCCCWWKSKILLFLCFNNSSVHQWNNQN